MSKFTVSVVEKYVPKRFESIGAWSYWLLSLLLSNCKFPNNDEDSILTFLLFRFNAPTEGMVTYCVSTSPDNLFESELAYDADKINPLSDAVTFWFGCLEEIKLLVVLYLLSGNIL